MKKRFLSVVALFFAAALGGNSAFCQDWPNLERYREANGVLLQQPAPKDRVVFMGNSITDNWAKFHPEFFKTNDFIGRGISGQVTSQMLCRFQSDVIALRPRIVVIMAGTNDIAQNNGYIAHEHILQNIQSMCELAKQNKIRPVLCSCLPAAAFKWRPEMKPAEDIKRLNEMIKAYAKANKIAYIDYHSALVDERGGLPQKFAKDGVHPNLEAYAIMEKILLENL